ncbi:MAG: neutral zinc metallopeptidase, partial [Thiogranum sp.]
MRWRGKRTSSNIEDRRGSSPGGFAGLGGLGGAGGRSGLLRVLPLLFRFLGVKGTVVVVLGFVAYSYFSGGGLPELPRETVGTTGQIGSTTKAGGVVKESAEEKELSQFVSVVLGDTEEAWHSLLEGHGQGYREPKLVLFRNAVNSACGMGQAAMGPFYCPADQKIYLDLGFFNELRERHDAP